VIAVVAGGTGLSGTFLLRELLVDVQISRVISVSRRPCGMSDKKLAEVLISDLAELPSIESQLKGDIYFSCLGTTNKAAGSKANYEKIDHDAVLDFAKIAQRHGAKSFTVVSSTGSNPNSFFFYPRLKGRTEADLRALSLQSLVIVKPAFLQGPRSEVRPAEVLITKIFVPIFGLLPDRVRRGSITDVQTLAAKMLVEGKAASPGVHLIEAKDIRV
jgi:uncharacterized protein YbjT (DUF2867 family)